MGKYCELNLDQDVFICLCVVGWITCLFVSYSLFNKIDRDGLIDPFHWSRLDFLNFKNNVYRVS